MSIYVCRDMYVFVLILTEIHTWDVYIYISLMKHWLIDVKAVILNKFEVILF